MDELTKIDQIRQRMDVSYKEAKEALDIADGDVVQAIIYLEEKQSQWDKKFEEQGGKIIRQVKEIIRKGNVTKVKIKKDGKTVAEIPANVGVVGLVGILASPPLAILAGVGTVAAVANKYTLEIIRPDGTTEEQPLDLVE
ncbi:MAG: DUF4342 domain-containing protein [Thermoanaerobacteraceae bacterium]|nr:DUF4342 domain-containing protein [Thermoanaerobacteraceae bacterium]